MARTAYMQLSKILAVILPSLCELWVAAKGRGPVLFVLPTRDMQANNNANLVHNTNHRESSILEVVARLDTSPYNQKKSSGLKRLRDLSTFDDFWLGSDCLGYVLYIHHRLFVTLGRLALVPPIHNCSSDANLCMVRCA